MVGAVDNVSDSDEKSSNAGGHELVRVLELRFVGSLRYSQTSMNVFLVLTIRTMVVGAVDRKMSCHHRKIPLQRGLKNEI